MDIKVAYNLNQIMYDKDISFRKLHQMSGVSVSQLNDIANNRKDATVTTLCKIAVAMHVNPEVLYSYTVV